MIDLLFLIFCQSWILLLGSDLPSNEGNCTWLSITGISAEQASLHLCKHPTNIDLLQLFQSTLTRVVRGLDCCNVFSIYLGWSPGLMCSSHFTRNLKKFKFDRSSKTRWYQIYNSQWFIWCTSYANGLKDDKYKALSILLFFSCSSSVHTKTLLEYTACILGKKRHRGNRKLKFSSQTQPVHLIIETLWYIINLIRTRLNMSSMKHVPRHSILSPPASSSTKSSSLYPIIYDYLRDSFQRDSGIIAFKKIMVHYHGSENDFPDRLARCCEIYGLILTPSASAIFTEKCNSNSFRSKFMEPGSTVLIAKDSVNLQLILELDYVYTACADASSIGQFVPELGRQANEFEQEGGVIPVPAFIELGFTEETALNRERISGFLTIQPFARELRQSRTQEDDPHVVRPIGYFSSFHPVLLHAKSDTRLLVQQMLSERLTEDDSPLLNELELAWEPLPASSLSDPEKTVLMLYGTDFLAESLSRLYHLLTRESGSYALNHPYYISTFRGQQFSVTFWQPDGKIGHYYPPPTEGRASSLCSCSQFLVCNDYSFREGNGSL